jgi:hypothetical protein
METTEDNEHLKNLKDQIVASIPRGWEFSDAWNTAPCMNGRTHTILVHKSGEGLCHGMTVMSLELGRKCPNGEFFNVRLVHPPNHDVNSATWERVEKWAKNPFALPFRLHRDGIYDEDDKIAISMDSIAFISSSAPADIDVTLLSDKFYSYEFFNKGIRDVVFEDLKSKLIGPEQDYDPMFKVANAYKKNLTKRVRQDDAIQQ